MASKKNIVQKAGSFLIEKGRAINDLGYTPPLGSISGYVKHRIRKGFTGRGGRLGKSIFR